MLLPALDYILERLDLDGMQLDVPVLLGDLRLALDQLLHQLPPLLVGLLDLPDLLLESLAQLPRLVPRIIQLMLLLLAQLTLSVEFITRHRQRQFLLQLVQLGQLMLTPVVGLDSLVLEGLEFVRHTDQFLLLGYHSLLER